MATPSLTRKTSAGVTLLSDEQSLGGVSFAFTERTGGVSEGVYASLNLGDRCGDDARAVAENLRRALVAFGAESALGSLVHPRQVHGDAIVTVRGSSDAELAQAREACERGADAVVCTAPGVPVILMFADCVPVVLVAPGGFAVVHSGRAGTMLRIAAKAAVALAREAGCAVSDIGAYLGPHVLGDEYEVAPQMVADAVAEFGAAAQVLGKPRHLDLGPCIAQALVDVGVLPERICDPRISTVAHPERFFSYRASGGKCGRHAALAWLPAHRE